MERWSGAPSGDSSQHCCLSEALGVLCLSEVEIFFFTGPVTKFLEYLISAPLIPLGCFGGLEVIGHLAVSLGERSHNFASSVSSPRCPMGAVNHLISRHIVSHAFPALSCFIQGFGHRDCACAYRLLPL